MHLLRRPLGRLAGALFLALPLVGHAAPPDPLRLVPGQADFFLKIEKPRQAVEGLLYNDLYQQALALAPVREQLNSTNARRFFQLLAYFEKELGVPRAELLDRLTGGGVVLAARFGNDNPPALFVAQGTDEALQRKFFATARAVLDQELARQEAREKLTTGSYQGVETLHVGGNFHAAVAGSALLISNKKNVLHLGIDRHLREEEPSLANRPDVAQARQLLPPDPLAWAWVNLEPAHKGDQAKEVFRLPRNEPILTIFFGGWLDVAGRAPFLCAGTYADAKGATTTIRLPRGRDGMPPALALHVPPSGQPGSRPLLEPKGVVFSQSWHFDLAQIWEQRQGLFNEAQVKNLEEGSRGLALFLAGNKLDKLLTQAGAYHRFVVARQEKTGGYKTVPDQKIPAFGFVTEMRDPENFGKSVEAILRGAALLGGNQFKLKLVEEKHGDRSIVGYRFPEDARLPQDVGNIRFNFTPSFARAGNQLVLASTAELCRELVDLVDREAKGPAGRGEPATHRMRFYAAGGVDLLKDVEDQLLAQTILDQAVSPGEAKRQVQVVLDLVRKLGTLQLESRYEKESFRYDIRLMLNK